MNPTLDFASALYPSLVKGDENVFMSPFSLVMALAMCVEGAKDDTYDGLCKALNIPDELDDHLQWEQSLFEVLQSLGEDNNYDLNIANALWPQQGLEFVPKFIGAIQDNFGGKLTEVNYANPEAAADTINSWCDEKTKGLIKKVISPEMINGLTRLILTNAIYFKGKWQKKFDKGDTRCLPWHNNDGKQIGRVDSMQLNSEFYYHELESFTALDIPYESDSGLFMTILLPKHNGTSYAANMEWIEGNIKGCFDLMSKQLVRAQVEVQIPKFKMETQYSLTQNLVDLGAELAFSDQADFSGITTTEPLKISDVIHKAYVKVDEEGTEAAAVTAVMMKRCMSAAPKPCKEFKADHPFLFFICKEDTILFAGKVCNPSE